jgi:hypothetical protein
MLIPTNRETSDETKPSDRPSSNGGDRCRGGVNSRMFENQPKDADDRVVVGSRDVVSVTERDAFHAHQHRDHRKRGRWSADNFGAALRRSNVAARGTGGCREAL